MARIEIVSTRIQRHHRPFSACLRVTFVAAIALLIIASAAGASPELPGATVSSQNTTVGLNQLGQLGAYDAAGFVGVRDSSGLDALSRDCPCDGWGVAEEGSASAMWVSPTGHTLEGSTGGIRELRSTSSSVLTEALLTEANTSAPTAKLTITHLLEETADKSSVALRVRIENLSNEPLAGLRYRRVFPISIYSEPNRTLTLKAGTAPGLRTVSGSDIPSNPLEPLPASNNADSQMTAFDLDLGTLTAHAQVQLVFYFVSAQGVQEATAALEASDVEAYQIVHESGHAEDSTVFAIGLAGVGGAPVVFPTKEGTTVASSSLLAGPHANVVHDPSQTNPSELAGLAEQAQENDQTVAALQNLEVSPARLKTTASYTRGVAGKAVGGVAVVFGLSFALAVLSRIKQSRRESIPN